MRCCWFFIPYLFVNIALDLKTRTVLDLDWHQGTTQSVAILLSCDLLALVRVVLDISPLLMTAMLQYVTRDQQRNGHLLWFASTTGSPGMAL